MIWKLYWCAMLVMVIGGLMGAADQNGEYRKVRFIWILIGSLLWIPILARTFPWR